MKSLKEIKFKSVKSLVALNAGLSLFLVGTLATVGIAGCSSKLKSNVPHECKKYPAWHINPSKPVPPKPKPKPDLPSDIKLLLINQTKQTPWDIVLKDLDYKNKPDWFTPITSKLNQTFLKNCLKYCLPLKKDSYFKNCHFEGIDQIGFCGAGALNHLKLTGFKEEVSFWVTIT